MKKIKNNYKYLVYFFEATALILFLYILIAPFYPEVKYNISQEKKDTPVVENVEDVNQYKKEIVQQVNFLPQAEFDVSPDRLIIKKIGVNIPIVVSESSEYGLSKGAWLDPEGSRPDRGGNTIVTGHRFKYLPPSNLTFYLLHKLESGDIVSVLWDKEYYFYKVKEKKVVKPEDLSILEDSNESILTLYTCDPIYSQKNRLVLVAELIESDYSNVSGNIE